MIPVCILCARAYYVLFEWEQYKDNLLSVFQINKGGLAIYGGILGGVADIILVAGGYCLCEYFIYGAGAFASVPANLVQGIGGLILSAVLYPILIAIPDVKQTALANS